MDRIVRAGEFYVLLLIFKQVSVLWKYSVIKKFKATKWLILQFITFRIRKSNFAFWSSPEEDS